MRSPRGSWVEQRPNVSRVRHAEVIARAVPASLRHDLAGESKRHFDSENAANTPRVAIADALVTCSRWCSKPPWTAMDRHGSRRPNRGEPVTATDLRAVR